MVSSLFVRNKEIPLLSFWGKGAWYEWFFRISDEILKYPPEWFLLKPFFPALVNIPNV